MPLTLETNTVQDGDTGRGGVRLCVLSRRYSKESIPVSCTGHKPNTPDLPIVSAATHYQHAHMIHIAEALAVSYKTDP